MDEIEQFNIPNTPFTFSGVSPDSSTFGASKYTIVSVSRDKSGSTYRFEKQITEALNKTLASCKLSPMAENIRLRVEEFNDRVSEVHGFLPLDQIPAYVSTNSCDETALVDAVYSSISAAVQYAKKLRDNEYGVNMLNIVITDGLENSSKYRKSDLQKFIDDVRSSEATGSIMTILVGVNDGGALSGKLEEFKNEVGIDKYISVGDVTDKSMARLAEFISRSVSSSSQAIQNPQAPVDPTAYAF